MGVGPADQSARWTSEADEMISARTSARVLVVDREGFKVQLETAKARQAAETSQGRYR
jgi:hypothetical protein